MKIIKYVFLTILIISKIKCGDIKSPEPESPKSFFEFTPLNLAAYESRDNDLRQILEISGNDETPDIAGRTPILWAISKDNAYAVDNLLEYNASIGATDRYGNNAISLTIKLERIKIAILLRDHLTKLIDNMTKSEKEIYGPCKLVWQLKNLNDFINNHLSNEESWFDKLRHELFQSNN